MMLWNTLKKHFKAIFLVSQEYLASTLSMDSFSPLEVLIPARSILIILLLLCLYSSHPWYRKWSILMSSWITSSLSFIIPRSFKNSRSVLLPSNSLLRQNRLIPLPSSFWNSIEENRGDLSAKVKKSRSMILNMNLMKVWNADELLCWLSAEDPDLGQPLRTQGQHQ